jgi:hypothetical protein
VIFCEQAYGDCRLIADRLPTPKQIQTLVQGVEAVVEVALMRSHR